MADTLVWQLFVTDPDGTLVELGFNLDLAHAQRPASGPGAG